LLLRATQWHAANYAASDKMQQVGQELSNKMIRWLQIVAAFAHSPNGGLIVAGAGRRLFIEI
jgi:hypothetical protein